MVWALSLLTTKLISRSLTPSHHLSGILSLIGFGNLGLAPTPFSALPPVDSLKASPKAISGRTSYLRVRLEFLLYPQLIPDLFNGHVVRSSTRSYSRFNLSMGRSPGFGSTAYNLSPFLDSLSLWLRTFLVLNLAIYRNSPDRSTKSTLSSFNALQLLVNTGF